MNSFKKNIDVDGFCRVKNAFSEGDLNYCEAIITTMMERDGVILGRLKNEMSGVTKPAQKNQMELVRPSLLSHCLQKSAVFNTCRTIAEDYFGGRAHYLFDHAIYKMPFNDTVTPWHQDQAYLGPNVVIPSLHFWIPFQDTTAHNGAMQFIKNSHSQLLQHRPAYEQSHILKVMEDPSDNIYSMDINRGDASIHTNLTLHSATSNKSEQTRKAWIIHFGQKSEWCKRWLQFKGATLKKLRS